MGASVRAWRADRDCDRIPIAEPFVMTPDTANRGALDLVVAALRNEAEDVISLTLSAPDGASLPAWRPGAHIDLTLPNGAVRQYSLCGEGGESSTWTVAVLRESKSRGGSKFIHERLSVGEQLRVSLPRNNFGLIEAERYLFIAGGIGITPILAMAREVASQGRPWTLVYGGRSRRSMAFLDELAALPGGDLKVYPEDESGLIDLPRFLDKPERATAVYCCGPEGLISAVETLCEAWPAGTLHRERFAPSKKTAELPKGAFEVELARSGRRLVVPPYTSLLTVLEDAGYKITNSCRAGICGTCLVGVLSGVPEHNDDILSDAERAAGDAMLVCVSRCKSGLLVLDL
jgi:ferredoxin-NADP reductase